MADLVTRLLLNDSQFNSNIERSKKQVQNFENLSKKFGSGIATGLTQIAAVAGVAGGAVAGFDKFINASQTTGDAWAVKVEQMKSSVDNFFYALNSGDLTSFSLGLGEIARQARETYEALDQLGNVRISYDYLGGKVDAEISRLRAISMDESLPAEERKQALDEWKAMVDEKKEMAINASEAAQDALFKMVAQDTRLRSSDIDNSDFDKALALDLKNAVYREEEKERLRAEYEEYKRKMKPLDHERGPLERRKTTMETLGGKDTEEYKKTIAKIAEIDKAQRKLSIHYKESIIFNKLLVRIKDEELIATTAIARESDAMLRNVYDNQNQLNRASKRVGNSIKKSNVDIVNENTVKDYELKLAELRKELNNTSNVAIAGKLSNEIEALEKEVERIKLVVKQAGFRQKYGERDLGVSKNEIQGTTKGFTTDLSKTKLPKLDLPIQNKDIDLVDQYSDRLSAMSTLMGSVSSIVDQGADSWLSYGAGVVQAIAMAIPQIMALTAVKKTEATANTEAAATGAASSVASIPFVGPVLAIAAVASIIAALANIPKFAGGGIIGGGSFVGDRLPIMANSGEMILNTRQQSNLFQMLSSSPRPSTSVSFDNPKVRGEDIYLSLKNYTKSTGKKL